MSNDYFTRRLHIAIRNQKEKDSITNKLKNLKHKTGWNFGELIFKALCVFENTLSDGK